VTASILVAVAAIGLLDWLSLNRPPREGALGTRAPLRQRGAADAGTLNEPASASSDDDLARCLEQNQLLRHGIDQGFSLYIATVRAVLADNQPGFWHCDDEAYEVVRSRLLGDADAQAAVEVINRHQEPRSALQLALVGRECETAFVVVSASEVLTEQMGTTGAECYLASVTFTLTSIPGIEEVMIDFDEGSHAVPGSYRRTDFLELFPFRTGLEEEAY
jgi:hypothetical protein